MHTKNVSITLILNGGYKRTWKEFRKEHVCYQKKEISAGAGKTILKYKLQQSEKKKGKQVGEITSFQEMPNLEYKWGYKERRKQGQVTTIRRKFSILLVQSPRGNVCYFF